MLRRLLFLLVLGMVFHAAPALATPISVYGAWHCGNDFCTWGSVRDMTDFDVKNRWLVDRGDGTGLPSVNLVVLSFVQPLKLLNKTTDAQTLCPKAARSTPRSQRTSSAARRRCGASGFHLRRLTLASGRAPPPSPKGSGRRAKSETLKTCTDDSPS